MKVLAIDPALRKMGYAILEGSGLGREPARVLDYGVHVNRPELRPSLCLVAIRDKVGDLIREHEPDECAVEGVIFVQSHATAITMGAARGAALLGAAEYGLPSFEYPPKRVKQNAVGRGNASKEQVALMMRAQFRLQETPAYDAADAMAVGLAHIQARAMHPGLLPDVRQL